MAATAPIKSFPAHVSPVTGTRELRSREQGAKSHRQETFLLESSVLSGRKFFSQKLSRELPLLPGNMFTLDEESIFLSASKSRSFLARKREGKYLLWW